MTLAIENLVLDSALLTLFSASFCVMLVTALQGEASVESKRGFDQLPPQRDRSLFREKRLAGKIERLCSTPESLEAIASEFVNK